LDHYKQNAAITNTVSVCSVSLSQSVHHVQVLVSQYRSNKCLLLPSTVYIPEANCPNICCGCCPGVLPW